MLAHKLMGGAGGPVYSDDVFSAYTYTSDGTAKTYTTGVDLLTNGGLLWLKGRSVGSNYGYGDHELFDSATVSSTRRYLRSNGTDALGTNGSVATVPFTTSGFSLTAGPQTNNRNGDTNIAYSFKKAPKFFDVVTYTGNGVAGRQISHALGQSVGMIIVKRTDAVSDWQVYHIGLTNAQYLNLNATTAVSTSISRWNNTSATASDFTLGDATAVNASGGTYVAYLFAHDTSTDGIIQCGSFATDVSGNATANLGWEPQWLMTKRTSSARDWSITDSMRGWPVNAAAQKLYPNLPNAETAGSENYPTATGFTHFAGDPSATYVYVAIRRPNKPPTTGTQVFSVTSQSTTGNSFVSTGFPVDLTLLRPSNSSTTCRVFDRLRGAANALITSTTAAEGQPGGYKNDSSVGIDENLFTDGFQCVYWNFKRAPGVFDVVCYTGTGSATTIPHSLGVVPELMIVKCRSSAFGWWVYHAGMAATDALILNDTLAKLTGNNAWGNTRPTASVFSPSNNGDNSTNAAASTYVNYLFATKAGISKVGTYTGNGGTQTINCGFSTGARFVLIKATSTTGNWTVIDTARGLVAGSDPYLALNTTAAEVTGEDCVDPDGTGFVVNTTAAALNTNGVTYLFLAFA